MTKQSTQPHPEAPRVSEAPLLDDATDLLRALAYYSDSPLDRVKLSSIAKRFLSANAPALSGRNPLDSKVRAWDIDKAWERSLWTNRRSA